eukprot:70835-Rhodomonas_salina.1
MAVTQWSCASATSSVLPEIASAPPEIASAPPEIASAPPEIASNTCGVARWRERPRTLGCIAYRTPRSTGVAAYAMPVPDTAYASTGHRVAAQRVPGWPRCTITHAGSTIRSLSTGHRVAA